MKNSRFSCYHKLRGPDALHRFSITIHRGDKFCDCLLFYRSSPLCKGVYFKRKEFSPIGCKFFTFKVKLFFQKGGKKNLPLKVMLDIEVQKIQTHLHFLTKKNGNTLLQCKSWSLYLNEKYEGIFFFFF